MLKLFSRLRFYLVLTIVLLGHPAFALPPGDLFVVPAGELEQALGTVIAEAQTQLEAGGDAGTVFRSPAFVLALMGLLGPLFTFLTTNGIKLSTTWIKGNRTRLVAGLLSVLSAGVGGYFGLTEVAGLSGFNGALLAALGALGTFGMAVGAHETVRSVTTGKRHPERKNAQLSGTVDLVLDGLLKEAAKLPPPFGLAASVVTGLYAKHGKAFVQDLIDSQRALSAAELNKAGDNFERANPVKVTGAP